MEDWLKDYLDNQNQSLRWLTSLLCQEPRGMMPAREWMDLLKKFGPISST